MTDRTRQYAEVAALLDALLDGTIGDGQRQQLQAIVENDAGAKRYYVHAIHLHASLEWDLRLRDMTEEESSPAHAERPPPRSHGDAREQIALARFYRFFSRTTPLSMSLAALLLGILLTAMAWMAPPFYRALRGPPIVAEVILARGVRWAPSVYVEGRPPSGLPMGQTVDLLQGTVALRFDSGTLVVLEGPAEFTAQGRNELQLHSGTLVARVPPSAVGFLVSTPTVDVVDLGTEFSIHVAEKETEVQVLKGGVEVRPRGRADHFARKLTAGQAAAFGKSSSQGFYTQEKEMNRAIFAGMVALLATAQGQAHAASATMSSTPFAESKVSTNGTLIGAINFGVSSLPVNGVTFVAQSAAGANNIALGGGITVSVFDGSAALAGTGVGGTGLYSDFAWTNNNAAHGNVIFSGLTVGQQYEVQFFIGDNRTVSGIQNKTVHVYDQGFPNGIPGPPNVPQPEIANLDYTKSAGADGADQIVIARFIADAPSQSFFIATDSNSTFTDGLGGSAVFPGHLNAFQIRAVPEPEGVTIWSLLTLSLAAFAYWRFRRNR